MGLLVIRIVAPQRRFDLAVPDETTLAALLPAALKLYDEAAAGPWSLRPPTGSPLTPWRTLRDNGLRHGSTLILERAIPPLPPPPPPRAEVRALPLAELRVVSGPSAGRRVPLEPGEHRVGGRRTSDVVLGDRALAPAHLVVQVDGAGGVTVAPAGTDVACLVDGERLTGPVRLEPGQLVAAGRTLLTFGRPGKGTPPPETAALATMQAHRIEPPAWSWRAKARARFRARLVELDRSLSAAREARLAALAAATPDAAELLFRLESGPLTSGRRPGHPDWLRLRLGWADRPAGLDVVVAPRGAPALRTEAIRLAIRHDTLRGAPVSLALAEHGPLGVAGDEAAALGFARWLAVQVAALHAPGEVALTAALPDRDGFEWLSRLPQALPGVPALAVGTDAARSLVGGLAALVAERTAGRAPGPQVVAILHGGVVPAAAWTLAAGRRVGVHVIWIDPGEERRRACGAVLDLPGGELRPWLTIRGLDSQLQGGADGLSPELARRAATALVPVPRRSEERILASWIRDRIDPRPRQLRVTPGVDAAGEPVELDLGHVVVAGGRGTGKTELLQAMIGSLAARHSPRSVELVLLGELRGVRELPHVVEARLSDALARRRGEAALVVAVDELPPAPHREPLLEALARIVRSGPADVHVLVATSEPAPVRAAIGAAVEVATGGLGTNAVVRDEAGRARELRGGGTDSLASLVAAIATVGRGLEP